MQKETIDKIDDQITLGFRLATGIRPSSSQLSILKDQYEGALNHFTENPSMADSLLSIGAMQRDSTLDKTRTAALALVASTIFNFDESYMKR